MAIRSTPQCCFADANSGLLCLSSDGTTDWIRTLRLARAAVEDGIKHAVITVSIECVPYVAQRIDQLRDLLCRHEMDLDVALAVEFQVTDDLFRQAVRVAALLHTPLRRYVFLRSPREACLPICPVIEQLHHMRFSTVLVSPERSVRFHQQPGELREVVAMGGLVQVSAASITDQTDPGRIRFCRKLMRERMVHCIGTETGRHHDLPISMQQAHRQIARWIGDAPADELCRLNALRIVRGDSTPRAPHPQRRWWILPRAA